MIKRQRTSLFLFGLAACFLGCFATVSHAQALFGEKDAANNLDRFDARHVPDDALAVAVLSPQQWFDSPALKFFPLEVLRVLGREEFGVDPADVVEIRAVVSLNPETMQPQLGTMIKLKGKVDPAKLAAVFGGDTDTIQVDKFTAYPIDGPPGAVLTLVDQNTVYLGMAEYLPSMLEAADGDGALSQVLRSMSNRPGLSVAITMEQVGPMVSGVAMQQAQQLAPDLQPLAQIPQFTDAIKLHVGFDGQTGSIELSFVGKDDIAAERIRSILTDGLTAVRELAIAEFSRSMESTGQSPAMKEAIESYANRMAAMVTSKLAPDRAGDHVTIALDSQVGFATVGVLGGILLPAVQSAREASRRMSASNNLKQIMLGFHNYHSAYKQLPVSAITDDDGKPLLSWRVALLPFLDQVELYRQFQLDEPWDSEHNLPLSKKLPSVYRSPGKRLPAGMTTYHAVVGKGLALEPLQKTRFRDFLDGLSNTIMVVEVNDDAAVPWSKPADLEIDMADPMARLGKARQGGFNLAMADGAVRFVSQNIDVTLFKALLTRAGGEAVPRDVK